MHQHLINISLISGISKKSRAIFQEIDAAVKTQNNSFSSPPQAQPTQNGHRSHREVSFLI